MLSRICLPDFEDFFSSGRYMSRPNWLNQWATWNEKSTLRNFTRTTYSPKQQYHRVSGWEHEHSQLHVDAFSTWLAFISESWSFDRMLVFVLEPILRSWGAPHPSLGPAVARTPPRLKLFCGAEFTTSTCFRSSCEELRFSLLIMETHEIIVTQELHHAYWSMEKSIIYLENSFLNPAFFFLLNWSIWPTSSSLSSLSEWTTLSFTGTVFGTRFTAIFRDIVGVLETC